MGKVKGAKAKQVKVSVQPVISQEAAERAARIASARKKIDKGGQEHTKRYIHLYPGTVSTLKALLAEGMNLNFNPEERSSENNLRIAEAVVKKGYAMGYLVKFPGSKREGAYSPDTFQDVIREMFTETRGRREGINELLAEDVADLFLKCTAISRNKHLRLVREMETETESEA